MSSYSKRTADDRINYYYDERQGVSEAGEVVRVRRNSHSKSDGTRTFSINDLARRSSRRKSRSRISTRRESSSPSPERRRSILSTNRRRRSQSRVRIEEPPTESDSEFTSKDTFIRSTRRRGSGPENAFVRDKSISRSASRSRSRSRAALTHLGRNITDPRDKSPHDLERKNSRINEVFRQRRDGLEIEEGVTLRRARTPSRGPRRRQSIDSDETGKSSRRRGTIGGELPVLGYNYGTGFVSAKRGDLVPVTVQQPQRTSRRDTETERVVEWKKNDRHRRERDVREIKDTRSSSRRDSGYYDDDRGYRSEGSKSRQQRLDYEEDDGYYPDRKVLPLEPRRQSIRSNYYSDRAEKLLAEADRERRAKPRSATENLKQASEYYKDGRKYYKTGNGILDGIKNLIN